MNFISTCWMNQQVVIAHQWQCGLLHNIEVRGFCFFAFGLLLFCRLTRENASQTEVRESHAQWKNNPRPGYSMYYPLFEEVVCAERCFAHHPLLFDTHTIFRWFFSVVTPLRVAKIISCSRLTLLVNNERPRQRAREKSLYGAGPVRHHLVSDINCFLRHDGFPSQGFS